MGQGDQAHQVMLKLESAMTVSSGVFPTTGLWLIKLQLYFNLHLLQMTTNAI